MDRSRQFHTPQQGLPESAGGSVARENHLAADALHGESSPAQVVPDRHLHGGNPSRRSLEPLQGNLSAAGAGLGLESEILEDRALAPLQQQVGNGQSQRVLRLLQPIDRSAEVAACGEPSRRRQAPHAQQPQHRATLAGVELVSELEPGLDSARGWIEPAPQVEFLGGRNDKKEDETDEIDLPF